jgi:hypothetical protein
MRPVTALSLVCVAGSTLAAWVGGSVTVQWQGQDANGFAGEPVRAQLSSLWGTAATPIHIGTQLGGLIVGRN